MAGYWVSHITSLATSLLLLEEPMVGMVMVLFSRGSPGRLLVRHPTYLSFLTQTGKGRGLLAGWLGTWSCWNFFLVVF